MSTAVNDMVVIASNPQELAQSQTTLIATMNAKITHSEKELDDACDLVHAANVAAIDDTAAKKLVKKEEHRLLYLRKVRDALAAGYVMLPNFQGDTIAIRVKRDRPEQKGQYQVGYTPSATMEAPDAIPGGEGKYVGPFPETSHYTRESDGKRTHSMTIEGFDDQLALPVEFMKPLVVQRTGAAMKLKIFDEIVIVKGSKRGDPLVIGRIINAYGGRKWHTRTAELSFLIAWFVDTATI